MSSSAHNLHKWQDAKDPKKDGSKQAYKQLAALDEVRDDDRDGDGADGNGADGMVLMG